MVHIIGEKTEYGIYVWKLPSGNILGDTDKNLLNIPARRGDLEAIKRLAEAAAYYGHPQGRPEFLAGVGRITEDQYREDIARRDEGLTPYGDTGAWRDANNGGQ